MNSQAEEIISSTGDVSPFILLKAHQNEDDLFRKMERLKACLTGSLVLFLIAGYLAFYFYGTTNTKKAEWSFQALLSSSAKSELKTANEKIKCQEAVINWNKELNKPLEKLTFEDFSVNPIKGTPENLVQLINEATKKHGIPGSLLSAQIWTETRFKEGLVFYGKNQGKIFDFYQKWNKKRNAYDVYVIYNLKYDAYKVKSAGHLYLGEVSVGFAQMNLGKGAQDTLTKENALDSKFSINFVGGRWEYFSSLYPKKSVLFLSMAYNNSPAAENGQSFISVGYNEKKFLSLPVVPTKDHRDDHKNQTDLANAKKILQYGKNTISIARNQKLTELYDDFFGKFKGNEELTKIIPEMRLLFVDQTDYHKMIGYEIDNIE